MSERLNTDNTTSRKSDCAQNYKNANPDWNGFFSYQHNSQN